MTNGIARAHWRLMTINDIDAVHHVANQVHPDFPEDRAVFEDRLALFPQGCFVLEKAEAIIGYGISHPWRLDDVPALNTCLGALPDENSTFYVHDIALLSQARSGGAASRAVTLMTEAAIEHGYASMALVAVNGSQSFWEHQGFMPRHVASLLGKLQSYSKDACYMVRRVGKS